MGGGVTYLTLCLSEWGLVPSTTPVSVSVFLSLSLYHLYGRVVSVSVSPVLSTSPFVSVPTLTLYRYSSPPESTPPPPNSVPRDLPLSKIGVLPSGTLTTRPETTIQGSPRSRTLIRTDRHTRARVQTWARTHAG